MGSEINKDEFDLESAQGYVDAVMSSQSGVRSAVELSPGTKTGKKRHLSDAEESDIDDSSVKKSKNESSSRKLSSAKRDSEGTDCSDDEREQKSKDKCRAKSSAFRLTKADVHINAEVSTNQLIQKMNQDMHKMFDSLTLKMDTIAEEIEKKLCAKFSQMLDKRINNEIRKVKEDIDSRISIVKEDLYDEIKDLNDKVADLNPGDSENKREVNIILRNVPERTNEHVCDTVNAILKDGLRLRDVSATRAERLSNQNNGNKETDRSTKSGLIVATLRNKDDKRKVMENKKKLNDSRNRHKGVFIHGDQSREERLQRSNLKTLIDSIKQGDGASLQLRGSRVVRENGNSSENSGERNQGENENRGQRLNRNHDTHVQRRRDSGPTSNRRDQSMHTPMRNQNQGSSRETRRSRNQPDRRRN